MRVSCVHVYWLVYFLAALWLHPARADEVFINNGDRIQGSVESMSAEKLTFKTAYAGEITIDWGAVARLVTDSPLEVTLDNERTFTGKLTSDKSGVLVIQSDSGSPSAPISTTQVQTLDPPEQPKKWELHGRVSAGIIVDTGNTDKDKLSSDGELKLSKAANWFTLDWETYHEKNDGVTTDNNSQINLTHERLLDEKWFIFSTGRFAQDQFANKNLFLALAGGAGYRFWTSPKKNLSVRLGPGYGFDEYSEPQSFLNGSTNRDYALGFGQFDFDNWLLKQILQVFLTASGGVDLEESENWKVNVRNGVRVPVWHKLFASLQYNFDYANQPADGKLKEDTKLQWKLGVEW